MAFPSTWTSTQSKWNWTLICCLYFKVSYAISTFSYLLPLHFFVVEFSIKLLFCPITRRWGTQLLGKTRGECTDKACTKYF
jgi:hypothetical protein